jgi:hypothetical protein
MQKPKIKLYLLEADKDLKPFLKEVGQIARASISKIQKVLPFKEPVDVVVYRYRTTDKDFLVSGYTPTGNTVWIYTDPSHKNYQKLLEKQLPKVLTHELHHACRWQGPGFGKTLKEALVTEGLAAHFETETFGGKPSDFYVQFSDKEIQRFWKLAQKDLNSKSFSYDDWFFGNVKRKIPKHAGYALAYWLIGKSLNGRKASELSISTAGQILLDINIKNYDKSNNF